MSEKDDRQAGILPHNMLADRRDVVDYLPNAIATGEPSDWRIGCSRFAMPSVIEREDMVSTGRHGCCETGITLGMLGQSMRHKDNSACLRLCPLMMKAKRGIRRVKALRLCEHLILPLPGGDQIGRKKQHIPTFMPQDFRTCELRVAKINAP